MILQEEALGANSKTQSIGNLANTSPGKEIAPDGQSVIYTRIFRTPHWYPIRATRQRALSVYEQISKLNFDGRTFEPYLPLRRRIVYSNDDFNNPTQYIQDSPLDDGLLFVKTVHNDFRAMLELDIKGLTPFYDHFSMNEYGTNNYLTIPERQMQSFKIIVESRIQDVLLDQNEAPSFLKGDDVVVIGGPFVGVEGKVLRYKGQKRVFVELPGLGIFGTAYVPSKWLRKI